KYIGNVIYGVAKAATDKLTSDMAHELHPHGIAVVSLYPGLVRTEAVLQAGVFDLSNSESPEFVGRAGVALASDTDAVRWSSPGWPCWARPSWCPVASASSGAGLPFLYGGCRLSAYSASAFRLACRFSCACASSRSTNSRTRCRPAERGRISVGRQSVSILIS